MDSLVIDEAVVRDYLLGRIGPDDEMSTQMDERMLVDPEFSLLVDVIEDEILDDYLDAALAPADLAAVEAHFLVPPERQRKLRRLHLIRRISRGAAGENAAPTQARPKTGISDRGRVWNIPGIRAWLELAAGVALMLCIAYFWKQHHELDLAVKKSNEKLALRADATTPTLAVPEAAVVTLNLTDSGLSRGDERSLPVAHLAPNVDMLNISIALTVQPRGRLRARLENGSAVIWSSEGWVARPVTGGAVLNITIPAAVVPEGISQLIVTLPGQGELPYWFTVTKTS